ncbi:MAG: carbamoyltransferase [Acidobacteria bacterium]|nr:carbamoyltransferase [Acidobacteriota bacterium]|tara:strand:- start:1055 stop:2806 length:1752 start_codon:yes stop_codon:yes gene_type:complete
MRILGLFVGKDSGVALIDNGSIVYAANEERFSRNKMHTGFPVRALGNLWEHTGLAPKDIDHIAFGGTTRPASDNALGISTLNTNMLRRFAGTLSQYAGRLLETELAYHSIRLILRLRTRQGLLKKEIRQHGLTAPVTFVDHHECHAYSAYFTSGFPECVVVTSDGGGDGVSGGVYLGQQGHLRRVSYTPRIHSAGNFWMYITFLLGMDPWRHGGKVTGLAAYEPCDEAYRTLLDAYGYSKEKLWFLNKKRLFLLPAIEYLQKTLKPFNSKQIAYGAQRLLEYALVGVTETAMRQYPLQNLALAGGTFANVRLNQLLFRLSQVKEGFIHPHMGDGGIPLGAAYAAWARLDNPSAARWCASERSLISHVYLGPDYTRDQMQEVLEFEGCEYELHESGLEQEVAELLLKDNVVAVFRGRMEYGPRSLGNRSILYGASDPNINTWLNRQLNRTEFMPFAPVVTQEAAPNYFLDLEQSARAASFMTVTCDCTDRMKQRCAAAVHLDGTARPQLVSRSGNLFMHNILTAYGKRSGDPVLVNTSFNMHEEPIVASPADAIRAFRLGHLDVLVMGQFVVKSKHINEKRAAD